MPRLFGLHHLGHQFAERWVDGLPGETRRQKADRERTLGVVLMMVIICVPVVLVALAYAVLNG
jgi:hypothetical protein